ncbi:MAG: ATP-binding protein [Candidatus Woesearchaeota archaeon]
MTGFDITKLGELNPWWIDKKKILNDINIINFNKSLFKWIPNLKYYLKLDNDVIYTIRGPRQIGKTTLIKNIIREILLEKNIKPENVFFWSCERNNADELNEILQTYFDWRINNKNERKYIFLDEISSIIDWHKEILHFYNKGDLINCSIVLSGSHSIDIKKSTEFLPGRRGSLDSPVDKILLPMKFSEYVFLLKPELKNKFSELNFLKNEDKIKTFFDLFNGIINQNLNNLLLYKKEFDNLLESYLLTGGIPKVINEYNSKEKISLNIYNIYITSILGDLNKYGYKEVFFKQAVSEIIKNLSNPISWNNITKNTEIRSHNTAQEYATALEDLYIANLVYKISLHDKKAQISMKKIYINDPFIFHSLDGWTKNKKDYFINSKENIFNSEIRGKIVEGLVYNHLTRLSYKLNPKDLFDPKDSIFYYKDDKNKEIDFILLYDDQFYPIEVKYQNTINESDFVCFKSFKKGVVITKNDFGLYRNYVKIPLTIFLMLI